MYVGCAWNEDDHAHPVTAVLAEAFLYLGALGNVSLRFFSKWFYFVSLDRPQSNVSALSAPHCISGVCGVKLFQ